MYYVIQCRFSDFLVQLCIENAFFFRSVQKYYYHVQKNCLFLGSCRNITIQGQGVPGVSCRAIFGVREEILIFGDIYTSGEAYTGSCLCRNIIGNSGFWICWIMDNEIG